MTDGSEKRNRQLAFELQNSQVCKIILKIVLKQGKQMMMMIMMMMMMTMMIINV